MEEAARQIRFRKLLGFEWNNEQLLAQALRDESFANEHRQDHPISNQKLAFLGDAVVELAVRHHLYETHTIRRGQLSMEADKVVSNRHLAEQAEAFQLGSYLSLGKRRIDENNGKTLARAFEAVVGAVFIDQGFEPAAALALRWLAGAVKLDSSTDHTESDG